MIYVEVSVITETVFFSVIMVFTDTLRMTMTVRFWISMLDAISNIFSIMPIALFNYVSRAAEIKDKLVSWPIILLSSEKKGRVLVL